MKKKHWFQESEENRQIHVENVKKAKKKYLEKLQRDPERLEIFKEKQREYQRNWKKKNKIKARNYAKEYARKQRLDTLLHYSNEGLRCACCGEEEVAFLALDHIEGGGNKHRKEIGVSSIFGYLKARGYPKGYQVLCHNCNMAKGFNGICPHKKL